ncbi:uroporphyrinogen-III synthase [Sabulicella rubraurantiaca]|uniref:uroporphyrinogen-III synthase n=1 Tax=Sabulicella rubraurantiaca TaxID=2811429 RepID=UPI001A957AC7|nr:uroporphyrinogen-III synthase [Sabulicella rubraurantiaca]
MTRPEPGAAETARRVFALGLEPVLAPALVLRSLPVAPFPPVQAVLLPSRASARALPLSDTPIWAVGEATAEEARRRGFRQVRAADGDAASLAAAVAATLDPAAGPLLLASGRGYGRDLLAALRGAGFRVIRRAVYAAGDADALPEEARAALTSGRVGQALFFSPRSASCILRLLEGAGLASRVAGISAIAISPRVAAVLSPLPWREVLVAPRPHQDPMLELLRRP